MASSTRSSQLKRGGEGEEPLSPEKKEQDIVMKLTSPLPKSINDDSDPGKGAHIDTVNSAEEVKNFSSPPSTTPSALDGMEKKMDDLQSTMEKLITTLATLTTKEESQKANEILDKSLIEMKKEILDRQTGTLVDINSKFDSKISEIEGKLVAAQKKEQDQDAKFKGLEAQLLAEKFKVSTLQKQIEDINECPTGNNDLKNQLEELKDMVLMKNEAQDEEIKEALFQINSLEAHGRRWALRIIGLPAPDTDFEKSDKTKDIILRFCSEKLDIKDLVTSDIDCAHRLGDVVDGKQTILFRCFARDVVDYLLRNKTRLKNSNIMLFEDMSYKDRRLLHAIKERTLEVESAWYLAGKIWAKLRTGKKIKISINDDLDEVLKGKAKPKRKRPAFKRRAPKTRTQTSPKQVNTGDEGISLINGANSPRILTNTSTTAHTSAEAPLSSTPAEQAELLASKPQDRKIPDETIRMREILESDASTVIA